MLVLLCFRDARLLSNLLESFFRVAIIETIGLFLCLAAEVCVLLTMKTVPLARQHVRVRGLNTSKESWESCTTNNGAGRWI
jgi:hypothetical protein